MLAEIRPDGTRQVERGLVERWTPEHGVTLEQSTRERYANVHALHVAPELDDMLLSAITVSVLRRWQARLIAAGMAPSSIHKCRTFLSSVLRHAAESEAIPGNPLTLVRAPRAEYREQVQPLAPATVERIRAALDVERAAIVSVLAYAGLRPGELRALRWGDVRERTILVQRGADPTGKAKATKTRAVRTVRLLAPLAADLREWRMASGAPARFGIGVSERCEGRGGPRTSGTCFGDARGPRHRGAQGWRRSRARTTSGTPSPRCCSRRAARSTTSRHSSGHSPALTLSTYGHLIAECADAGSIDCEQEIAKARADGTTTSSGDRTPMVAALSS